VLKFLDIFRFWKYALRIEIHRLNIEEKGRIMNLLKKIGRGLSVLAIAPFSELENRERDRRLEERLKRSREKQSHL